MNGLYFDFPDGWWLVTAIFYIPWFILFVQSGTYRKTGELKVQIVFGVVALVLAFIVENIAIPSGLWTYFPGNWPVILWVNYFGSGLLGYQLFKKIEKIFR